MIPRKIKLVLDVAKWNSSLSSFLFIFKSGSLLKIISTAKSIVSLSGTFVKRLQTSKETVNFPSMLLFFNSFKKLKESEKLCSQGVIFLTKLPK